MSEDNLGRNPFGRYTRNLDYIEPANPLMFESSTNVDYAEHCDKSSSNKADILSACDAFCEIIDFVCGGKNKGGGVYSAFRRFISVAWVLRPQVLGDPTLTELGSQLGVSRAAMSQLVLRFTDRFGVHVSRQKPSDLRKVFKHSQIQKNKKRQKIPTQNEQS